jgi:hypothetical protein
MNYKNYDLNIWDKVGWESAGKSVGWYIEIYEPDKYILGGEHLEEFDILLTPDEANQLNLEKEFSEYPLEDRQVYYPLKDFIEKLDVPERVYGLLENLPE